jgi:hypothetical protein
MAGAEVDYRKAAMPKSNAAIDKGTGAVRASVGQRVPHAGQQRVINAPIQMIWDGYAADSAHR